MARVQRVRYGDRPDTHVVVGADGLPVPPAREFLRFVTDGGGSPNTVRAYAAGLAQWWTLLEHTGCAWDDFPTSLFGTFLTFLRAGDLPGTSRIGEPAEAASASTVQLRTAAVLSMYRFHADAHHLQVPYDRLFTSRRQWRRESRYVGFLDGVGPRRGGDRPVYRVREANRLTTPVLAPDQVSTILDSCCIRADGGSWSGQAGRSA